ncbi:MAG TPA: M20/M25/M40 family metallo-hydrolase [Terriglobales bacterium]|nr:M20/M25/M40 family metallo-hydrolase [Terriglobales bacterium]
MIKRINAVTALFILLVSFPAWSEKPDAERHARHVQALASKQMEGRGVGSKGLDRARDYLRKEFEKHGLRPAGDNGSFLQTFTVTTGARLKGQNRMEMSLPGGRRDKLRLREDFVPFSFSSSGTVQAQVVFAGYGITAPEFNYDDYTHFDVKDKIVVMLRNEPAAITKKAGRRTMHSSVINKAINARNHGAKAVILINGRLEGTEEDRLRRFDSMAGPEDAGVLMLYAKNVVAEKLLKTAGQSLIDVQKGIDEKPEPNSLAMPKELQLTLSVNLQRMRAQVSNVVGYLPGETEEYVVLGAHYDHLGKGSASSLAPSLIGSVHFGADDNASGTSGLLELARAIQSEPGKRKRGILFIAFAAEEIGLLGSSYWVNHPTRPLADAVAMINMDMIGRIKDGKVFVGGAASGSTFTALVEQAATQGEVRVDVSGMAGSGSSDHVSFLVKKIPSLFFFSGLHGDYHKPSDTAEKIDSVAAARLLGVVEEITLRVANGERPVFNRVEEARMPAGGSGGGYGPYFGSIPDFGEDPRGVKFADVRAGSPAEKAGLKSGDILTQFGAQAIKNLYDFTFALRQHKPGDVVKVTVLRDSKTLTVDVTLTQRK